MENKHSPAVIVLSVIVVVLLCALLYKTRIVQTPDSQATTSTPTVVTTTPVNFVGKEISAGDLIVVVPQRLSAKTEGDAIVVNHSIKYKHPNVCDFKGGSKPLALLTDFNVKFEAVTGDLTQAVIHSQGEEFARQSMKDGKFVESKGFIEPFAIGTLQGYRVEIGVEWCGQYHYYFPLTNGKYLLAQRDFVSEFNVDPKKYLKLPNVIPPMQADLFFEQIIQSARIK